MDVLKNSDKKIYSSLSRYANLYYSYNTLDNKYMYHLGEQLSKDTPHTLVDIKPEDTLDSLSNKYYGRPDYFWVIADFNNILDCFINLYENYKEIKIPVLSAIEYEG